MCSSPGCATYHTCEQADPFGDSPRHSTPSTQAEEEAQECIKAETGGSDCQDFVRSSYSILASAMRDHSEKWMKFEEGLYIKVHPLTELNRCYIVHENVERKFGRLADWKRVLERVAWSFPLAFVINISERQTLQLEAAGSPHPIGVKRAVRTARSAQCLLILVDEEESTSAYAEASLYPAEAPQKPCVNVKDKLTMAALRSWSYLEFWRQ